MSYIPIRPDSSSIKGPGFVLADKPVYVSFGARVIFEGVDLVFCPVVPVVVEGGESGHSLLVGTAAVGVYTCYLVVIYRGKVWVVLLVLLGLHWGGNKIDGLP